MKKHWDNLKYVVRHKVAVFKMGLKYRVWWHQLIVHDWTKFLPSEWFGYANHFFAKAPIRDELERLRALGIKSMGQCEDIARLQLLLNQWQDDFYLAWNYHQKRNKHHWNYWVSIGDGGKFTPLKMPERFVREMVADWAGASIAIRGFDDTVNWYTKNRELILLHPKTRDLVEELIGYHRQEVLLKAG